MNGVQARTIVHRLFYSGIVCSACLLLCLLLGCNSETEEPSTNVIKDYVNTPKERALGARDAVEGAQNRMRELADDGEKDYGEEDYEEEE